MLKQDTKVSFKIGNFEGEGKVVGQALNALPLIGITYIIQLDYILTEEYPYNTFSCPEIYLQEILEEEEDGSTDEEILERLTLKYKILEYEYENKTSQTK